jgi:uncharacterized damage-inducible protein DinB
MTEDLRYPIGKFQFDPNVTPEQRQAGIAAVEALPQRLRAAVAGLTEEQLETPYREGGWTVRQVVHHLADANVNSYVRFKLGMTEQTPPIKPFEENGWATTPDTKAPVEASLQLLDGLQARWAMLLKGMSPADFARTVAHPVAGEMTLDRVLALYAWHGRHHTAHITALRQRVGW